MSFRRVIFWSHLTVGVAIALVVLMLSATGVLLTYEHQITGWAAKGAWPEATNAPPLSADEMAASAMAVTDGRVTALVYADEPGAPVTAEISRREQVLLNPYSGAVIDSEPANVERFFRIVTALHRWFALRGEARETGAAITGAANLGFLFLLISGFYLWWPKAWKWRIVRMNLLFRRNLPNAKARDFNWHHVFGFWALIPLFFIVVSGVVISYPSASRLLYAVYGEEPAQRSGPPGGRGANSTNSDRLVLIEDGTGLQPLLDAAATYDEDWNTLKIALPKREGADSVDITVDTGNGRQFAQQTTLTYAQADGALIAEKSYEETTSPGFRARIYMRFVHTGEVYGVTGQTIAGLASLATLFMAYTGLALSYRRLIRPLFTRRHQPDSAART